MEFIVSRLSVFFVLVFGLDYNDSVGATGVFLQNSRTVGKGVFGFGVQKVGEKGGGDGEIGSFDLNKNLNVLLGSDVFETGSLGF